MGGGILILILLPGNRQRQTLSRRLRPTSRRLRADILRRRRERILLTSRRRHERDVSDRVGEIAEAAKRLGCRLKPRRSPRLPRRDQTWVLHWRRHDFSAVLSNAGNVQEIPLTEYDCPDALSVLSVYALSVKTLTRYNLSGEIDGKTGGSHLDAIRP
jgi:hypothetical protein